jgi:hypothetical protein
MLVNVVAGCCYWVSNFTTARGSVSWRSIGRCRLGPWAACRVTLRFADAVGTVVAKANDQEYARQLVACWNAFLQAGTTDAERVAVRRIRRSYRKRHPPRDACDRVLRDVYDAERRAAAEALQISVVMIQGFMCKDRSR